MITYCVYQATRTVDPLSSSSEGNQRNGELHHQGWSSSPASICSSTSSIARDRETQWIRLTHNFSHSYRANNQYQIHQSKPINQWTSLPSNRKSRWRRLTSQPSRTSWTNQLISYKMRSDSLLAWGRYKRRLRRRSASQQRFRTRIRLVCNSYQRLKPLVISWRLVQWPLSTTVSWDNLQSGPAGRHAADRRGGSRSDDENIHIVWFKSVF